MRSISVFVLRLILGTLFIAHGYPKLFGGQGTGEKIPEQQKQQLGETFVEQMEQGGVQQTAGFLESIGTPNPQQAAWAVALTEFVGGIALILGWKARLAAVGNIVAQLVAINKVHKDQGLVSGYELNLALIGGLAVIALDGPGKLALD
ncbi:MAG: DoxX family protein [Chloroflexota bacterium]|nr:DoxX family protein [Chloroflexota bacterium]